MEQVKLPVKKGDEVVVIAGVAKGEQGTVLRTLPKKRRVVIEGVALRKKHVRPRKQGEKGQTVMVPASIHVSNVKVLSSATKKEQS